MGTFYEWLTVRKRLKENSPIGDFARDAVADSNFPRGAKRIQEVHDYLYGYPVNACLACHECADEAWAKYKKTENKNWYLEFLRGNAEDGYEESILLEYTTDSEITPILPEKIANARREQIAPKVRFEIFKRDGYRCQICGATARDGVRLEVDHKLPVKKAGDNSFDNLWVLCFTCNRGKAARSL